MLIAYFVPATTRLISLLAISSTVGLITKLLSMRPTITPAIGPMKGMLDMDNAIDVPIIAAISDGQLGSADITVAVICTSFLNPSGNKGRIVLSIKREVRIAFSLGLPSRLINPPGILPTAYNLSS